MSGNFLAWFEYLFTSPKKLPVSLRERPALVLLSGFVLTGISARLLYLGLTRDGEAMATFLGFVLLLLSLSIFHTWSQIKK
jgi:hypothetical protein